MVRICLFGNMANGQGEEHISTTFICFDKPGPLKSIP